VSGSDTSPGSHPPLWRNRNFLSLFAGLFVTNAGDSLYSVATMWLVFELSNSTFLTGVANSLLLLPFLVQIVAGPIVDRFPVQRVLLVSQAVQGAVVLVLPLAASTGHLSTGLILVTVPVLSVMTVVTDPARASIVPRIVADHQLSRGNSALATVSLGLDMVFDALGGAFVAVFGATALFLVDSATFAVAALLFVSMSVPAADDTDTATSGSEPEGVDSSTETTDTQPSVRSVLAAYVADLRGGVDTLRGTLFVDTLFTTAVSNFAVGVTLAVLPAYGALVGGPTAHGGLVSGPTAYGLLLGALGVGRLVGSVIAPRLKTLPLGQLTAVSFTAGSLLWLGSVLVSSTLLTVVLFGLAWIGAGANGVLVSTVNQRVFPTDVLGRVTAIKGTAASATLPVGSLVGGTVAVIVGPSTTVALAAGGFGFVGLYHALRTPLRRLPATSDISAADFGLELEPEDTE
jgi:MFS family permease